MIGKLKTWWRGLRRKRIHHEIENIEQAYGYTAEQLENAYKLGYTDGKRDGLTIAREQASNALKEILWQQNNPSKTK